MANQEQVDRLLRGVETWNQWRKENPNVKPDLSGADLTKADLDFNPGSLFLDSNNMISLGDLWDALEAFIGANLSNANLSGANLSGAIFYKADLSRANLSNANLSGADLRSADLSVANLSNAGLWRADLSGAKLSHAELSHANFYDASLSHADLRYALFWFTELSSANLHEADFRDTNLSSANLSSANLSSANLKGANLSSANLRLTRLNRANFSNANLSNADLSAAQALDANFNTATLTGACIGNWNINAQTNFQDVICEYVFTKYDRKSHQFTDRIPHDLTKTFAPGDFAKLVQQSLNTVNLIFREGLDWRSFAYSFQQLQVQYANEQIAIQNIENKGDGTVVVKLAVAPDTDKGSIEQSFWRGFEIAQKTIVGQYETRLEDKNKHINQLFTLLQQSQERLGEVPKLMTENPRYDLRGAKFGGGFAADGGTQTGGTFNDFSQNIEQNINEIDGLIQTLRTQAETFPEGVRQETIDHIADLETDIGQPPEKRKPSRIKATLLALAGMATLVSGMVAGANEFATNVQELSEKLGIPLPIERVQPQAQHSDAIDVKAIKADQP